VWAYCFMPNHIHLILTPTRSNGLGLAVGETHRRYTNFINARGRWTGHLFQNRFASVAMDELHLLTAVSYVSLNPVRAGLVGYAADWEWSSVRAHLAGKDDGLVTVRPVLDRVPAFRTCSWRIQRRPLLPCGAPRVPGVRLVPRSLSPALNAYSDDGLHGVPQDPPRQPTSVTSS
jgi:hypothetical protein